LLVPPGDALIALHLRSCILAGSAVGRGSGSMQQADAAVLIFFSLLR